MGLKHLSLAGAVLLAFSQSASALIINFDYSYDTNNFFSNQTRKNILSEAGNFFGSRITDNLTAITSGGGNHFNAVINHPGSGVTTTLNDFNVAADTLTVFVGGRVLGGSTLGQGGYGGWGASANNALFFDNIRQRGQAGPTSGAGATDFAPWGGQITFDTNSSWYFDTDISTTESFSGSDFYSVALHEIGHLLGLGTAASWTAKETSGVFSGANAVAAFGANIPLEADGAHWLNGTKSKTLAGVTQEAMMDPSITTGTRKLPTQLDLAALKDVGWQLRPVPVPSAVWLFGSALIAFAGVRRRQSIAA